MLAALVGLLGGRALRQRDLRLLYIAVFLTELGVSAAFPLRMLYARAHHATPAQLGMIAGVFFLAPILVQLPLGWLVDRWGRGPVMLWAGLLISVVYASYGFVSSLVLLVVLGIIEGLFQVFQQPAVQSLLADASPPAARGRAQGVAGVAGALGGASSAFISLPLYHQDRTAPFVVAGIVMAVGSLLAALSAIRLARGRERARAGARQVEECGPLPC